MQINVSYDSSAANAPAGFKVDVQYAVSVLEAAFTNNVTLNIDVGWGEVDGSAIRTDDLGESLYVKAPTYTYSQIVGALEAQAAQPNLNPDLTAAISTLTGLANPTDGGPFDIGLPEAQALGLAANNPNALDGWIGFAANASEWSYSTTGTPAPDKFYLVGSILHEITEVMGRVSDLGTQGEWYRDAWGVADLFRFSAPGVRQLAPGAAHTTGYFSIDDGQTNLGTWNNHIARGDLADWDFGNRAGGGPGPHGADSFNNISNPGVLNQITNDDLTLMHVLGWTPSEPDNFVLKGEMYYVPAGDVVSDPLLIMSKGTVDIADGGSVTGTITFHGQGGLLTIEGDTPPSNAIGGFVAGDTIDFKGAHIGANPTVTLLQDNVLQIVEHGQTYDFLFDRNEDFSGQHFHVEGDGSGGTLIYIEPSLTTVGSPGPGSTPSSTSVAVTGPDITNGSGDLDAGHVVTFTLTMNTDVLVDTTNGTPTLSLNDGEVASYSGGSGSSQLSFTYTVASGDNTSALAVTAVNLNGGTVQDLNGHDADLSGAVGQPAGTLQIDTTPPQLTNVSASGPSSWVLGFSEPVMPHGTPSFSLASQPATYDASATAALHDPTKMVFDFSQLNSPPPSAGGPDYELSGITDLAGNPTAVNATAAASSTHPGTGDLIISSDLPTDGQTGQLHGAAFADSSVHDQPGAGALFFHL